MIFVTFLSSRVISLEFFQVDPIMSHLVTTTHCALSQLPQLPSFVSAVHFHAGLSPLLNYNLLERKDHRFAQVQGQKPSNKCPRDSSQMPALPRSGTSEA